MRPTRRRLAVLAAAAGAASVGLAGPAAAATTGHIQQVSASHGRLQVVFGGAGLAADDRIDPASVRLTVDGRPVTATAAPAGGAQRVTRTAVLAIDTSGSMAGAGLAGAQQAALSFLASVPPAVRVGLVTFSDTPVLRVAPTTDRASLRQAVSRLTAHGETALYDAVSLALSAAGSDGARTVLVLTDGGDTRSTHDAGAVRRQVAASRAVVDAVAFRTTDTQAGALATLTAGGGRVLSTGQTSAVAAAFRDAAADVANTVVVTGPVPASAAGRQATVGVTARAGGRTLSDSVAALLPTAAAAGSSPRATAPVPASAHVTALQRRWALYAGLAALFVGVTLLAAVALGGLARDRSESRMRRRLSIYTLGGRPAPRPQEAGAFGANPIARSAVELAGRVVDRRGFAELLATRLTAAGLPLKPAEWLLMHFGCTLGLGLLALLLTDRALPALLALAVGAVGPMVFLSAKESRRTAAFAGQLADTLQLMAGSLQAGHSLPQAVDAVVREGAQPIAGEFRKAMVETRLGVPIEDALEAVADRMRSEDFAWVVMAIRIQREVGGNLAEVLHTVADTLRERERLRRQVKVLSAEGRLSAWILGSLPVLFAAYLVFVRPDYIRPLWHDPLGVVMLIVMAVAMLVGVLWLRKVVRVEV